MRIHDDLTILFYMVAAIVLLMLSPLIFSKVKNNELHIRCYGLILQLILIKLSYEQLMVDIYLNRPFIVFLFLLVFWIVIIVDNLRTIKKILKNRK